MIETDKGVYYFLTIQDDKLIKDSYRNGYLGIIRILES